MRRCGEQVNMVGPKMILIIDDDPAVCGELEHFLQGYGYAVTAAADSQQAFACMEVMTPDLIFLDIIMPKTDGFTLAKKIRHDKRTATVPIIVFSAQENMRELFAMEGLHDYLSKPLDYEKVLAAVRAKIG
ncbi:MAG: response regulator [Candidatus Omnitrophica bacterium]|nr:response regulator [Candidatus Omnitrophota bacterium]